MSHYLSQLRRWADRHTRSAVVLGYLALYGVLWVPAQLLGHPKPSEFAFTWATLPWVAFMILALFMFAIALIAGLLKRL